MLTTLMAIAAGASLGAIARWLLGNGLNALFPDIPPGTLAANLIGGYLIGVAIGYFAAHPTLAPEWRLLVITGFLGGLTTFSTFSAEVVTLLQQGRLLWAAAAIGVHVTGSVAMTLAGMATWHWAHTRGGT
jgi:CrcB protein